MNGISIALTIHSLDPTTNRKMGIHTRCLENGKKDCLDQ